MAERRRPPQLRVFVRFLRVICLAFYAPTAFALWQLHGQLGGVRLGPTLAIALGVLVIVGVGPRVRAGFSDVPRPAWVGALLWPLFDMLWCSVLVAPAAMLLATPAAAFAPKIRTPATIMQLGAAVALLAGAYGVFLRRHWFRVRRVEVPIVGLPRDLDGFRIAHLSDLHVGTSTRAQAAMRWVRSANALKADVVAVTGDVLTAGSAFHDEVVDVLGALRAREAVAFCLGNHDYYEENELCARLADKGIRVLRNAGFAIDRGPSQLWIAGVEDVWRGEVDLPRALADAPPNAKSILLAHNPKLFPQAVQANVTLTLSGHTHAGQVAMPFLTEQLNLARLTEKHTAGYYRIGDSHLFVHAGLGTTGPGFRLGAAPELVELVLRAA